MKSINEYQEVKYYDLFETIELLKRHISIDKVIKDDLLKSKMIEGKEYFRERDIRRVISNAIEYATTLN